MSWVSAPLWRVSSIWSCGFGFVVAMVIWYFESFGCLLVG